MSWELVRRFSFEVGCLRTLNPATLLAPAAQLARSTWQRVSAGATTISRLQRDVVACLRRLGTQPHCERVTLDGLFSIDTSLEWGGRQDSEGQEDGGWGAAGPLACFQVLSPVRVCVGEGPLRADPGFRV
jgi:hypothetical protein